MSLEESEELARELNEFGYRETTDPDGADRRRFCKVEKLDTSELHVEALLYASNDLSKARAIFAAWKARRPRGRYTLRQNIRVLGRWPPDPRLAHGPQTAPRPCKSPSLVAARAVCVIPRCVELMHGLGDCLLGRQNEATRRPCQCHTRRECRRANAEGRPCPCWAPLASWRLRVARPLRHPWTRRRQTPV